jgi:hypothetical protein
MAENLSSPRARAVRARVDLLASRKRLIPDHHREVGGRERIEEILFSVIS